MARRSSRSRRRHRSRRRARCNGWRHSRCAVGRRPRRRPTGSPLASFARHHSSMTATIDLRERLRAGETVFGTFLNLGSPLAAELCARAGFDWLVIDLEHGAATEADLLGILHAVGRYPVAAIVRPQSGERLRIGRALDAGADGIMVPRLDTPDEVREAVSFLRFPPDGV